MMATNIHRTLDLPSGSTPNQTAIVLYEKQYYNFWYAVDRNTCGSAPTLDKLYVYQTQLPCIVS